MRDQYEACSTCGGEDKDCTDCGGSGIESRTFEMPMDVSVRIRYAVTWDTEYEEPRIRPVEILTPKNDMLLSAEHPYKEALERQQEHVERVWSEKFEGDQ